MFQLVLGYQNLRDEEISRFAETLPVSLLQEFHAAVLADELAANTVQAVAVSGSPSTSGSL